MTRIHGKNTYIDVGGNDLSNFINNSEFGRSRDTSDVSGYGDDNKAYIAGQQDGTFSCEGSYDDGASGPRAILEPLLDSGAETTIIRRPEGTGTGLPQESFGAILTSYVETNPVADKITWSAEFQKTGAITETVQA